MQIMHFALGAALLLAGSAQAACTFNFTIVNGGTAGTDQTFDINWQQSQFQDAGVWHRVCGANNRPACQPSNTQTIVIGTPITQRFKSVTEGCNQKRTFRMVTALAGNTETYTAQCVSSKETSNTADITMTMTWANNSGTPALNQCTTTAE